MRIPPVIGVVVLVWTAAIVVAFLGVRAQSASTVATIALTGARTLANQIVDARTWNANHGGVYVGIDEQTQPNPHLDVPDRDIVTTNDRELTLVNPAFMTRQIAEIAALRHGTTIHLTSLNPIRPENAPTEWERTALELFETGVSEWSAFESDQEGPSFRYIRAISTEASCLACHEVQGYAVGDVRGGLSVDLPVGSLIRAGLRYRTGMGVALALAWALGIAVVGAVFSGFRHKQKLVDELERLSVTDDLTGLMNRRGFFKFGELQLGLAERLGKLAVVYFFDVDRLKEINDSRGHRVGDRVLRATSELLRSTFRESDLIARYGGDEFVVLTVGNAGEGTRSVISRFRMLCRQHESPSDSYRRFRVSAGWAPVDPKQARPLEIAAAEADKKMYEDKPLPDLP